MERVELEPVGNRSPVRWRGRAWCLLLLLLLASSATRAQDGDDDGRASQSRSAPEDRAGLFTSIVVTPDKPAADVACMFCTVQIDGDVRGDVAVLFGTVNVGEGQTIRGDTALLFSTLNARDGARLNGDLATAFSTVQIAPSAQVHGDRAMMASGLGLAVLLGPILIVVGLVWLLVWVARRAFL